MMQPVMYYLDESGQPAGSEGPDDPRFREWYEHYRDTGGVRGKRVAQNDVDHYWVSTVFLSIDHAFHGGPPILWETLVFDKETGASDLYCNRYTSRESAEHGHSRVVAALLAGTRPEDIDPR